METIITVSIKDSSKVNNMFFEAFLRFKNPCFEKFVFEKTGDAEEAIELLKSNNIAFDSRKD